MPETVQDKKIFSLLEVTRSIQKTITERYKSAFWVKAEMNKLNFYKLSGNCYPDLVEKQGGKIIAQMRSTLWRDDYYRIDRNFQKILKEPLKDGIKILFMAQITFDPSHGLSLQIIDIDPSYTLGDLEKEKRDTIEKLRKEGLFDRNKSLKLPLLPQRLAIISVETSKGYADFVEIIKSYNHQYVFFQMLFPSLLQGDKAVDTLVAQLGNIKKVAHHFDVVAIVRGGGGEIGLTCYNHYKLCRAVALFPLPVITGIGHATNETVVEMVSFYNAITPTKLAETLIQRFRDFSQSVQKSQDKISRWAIKHLGTNKQQFDNQVNLFRNTTENALQFQSSLVKNTSTSMAQTIRFALSKEKRRIADANESLIKESKAQTAKAAQTIRQFAFSIGKDATAQMAQSTIRVSQLSQDMAKAMARSIQNHQREVIQSQAQLAHSCRQTLKENDYRLTAHAQTVNILSPMNILKRGYSITLQNGKVITDPNSLLPGQKLTTILHNATIESTIISTNPS